MNQNDSSGSSSQSALQKQVKLINQVKEFFIAELSNQLIHYYETADDALYDMSQRAQSNQEQTLFFYSMQELRRKKDLITKKFINQINQIFQLFSQGTYHYFDKQDSNTDLSTRQLTLMEEQELDKMLAVANSISKARTYLSRQLVDLNKRFCVLSNKAEAELTDIPLSPNVLVNSFVQAMKVQDGMSSPVFVVMVKMFERSIILNLKNIYDSVNELLATNGILPNLRLQVKKSNNSEYSRNDSLHQSLPQLAEQINQLAKESFSEDSNFADILLNLEHQQAQGHGHGIGI